MIIRAKKEKQILYSLGNLTKTKMKYDYISISMGAFDWLLVILWAMRKKCARIWIGTDVLKCQYFDYRLRARIASFFCDNLTVACWLTNELKEYKIKAKTLKHEYINILSKWIPEKN